MSNVSLIDGHIDEPKKTVVKCLMTDRDRLIKLVDKAKQEYANDIIDHTETDYIVETLLNEGVMLPPCKVGDTVYMPFDGEVVPLLITHISTEETIGKVSKCYIADGDKVATNFADYHIGKTVFLTKEEAERELKKRRDIENGKR